MDRAQRHRRGEGTEGTEGQIEARMTRNYQKRKGTSRLANSPTPSFSGCRTEAGAECNLRIFNN